MGVPVRAQLREREMARTTWLVVLDAVLDPLGFVEHDQVEVQVGIDDHVAVAHQQFVVGDLDRASAAAAIATRGGRGRLR